MPKQEFPFPMPNGWFCIVRSHELENGNLVYTSGKDGVLLPGIPIGKVKLNDQSVEVELLTDINQILYVDVILDKNVIEEDME